MSPSTAPSAKPPFPLQERRKPQPNSVFSTLCALATVAAPFFIILVLLNIMPEDAPTTTPQQKTTEAAPTDATLSQPLLDAQTCTWQLKSQPVAADHSIVVTYQQWQAICPTTCTTDTSAASNRLPCVVPPMPQ